MPGVRDEGAFLQGLYVEQDFAASAARTTSGDTGVFSAYGPASTLRAQLDVTAASGTSPTLNVVIEDTLDGTNWNVVATFAQRTAAGREVVNVTSPFANRLRARWTLGGTTPSFTFSVRVASQVPEVA
jgi:hypothetical protein